MKNRTGFTLLFLNNYPSVTAWKGPKTDKVNHFHCFSLMCMDKKNNPAAGAVSFIKPV